MPVQGIFDHIRAYGKEYLVVSVSMTIGTGDGDVASVEGAGFSTGSTAIENKGSVTRDSAGVYTIVLPGRGSVHRIIPFMPVIESTAAADLKNPMMTAKDLSARSVTFTFFDALGDGTPAAEELTDGTVVHFVFLVKNSNISA